MEYRIGDVARLIGVTPHALRAWERRHSLVSPQRTTNGERVYSDDEVRRLTLVKQLSSFGHPLGELAQQSTPDLEGLLERTRSLAQNGGP